MLNHIVSWKPNHAAMLKQYQVERSKEDQGIKEVPANKMSIGKRKLVHGYGINDANYMVYVKVDGKRTICPFYRKWLNMLTRCYNEKFHHKNPTYIGCLVSEEWLTFSKFKSWMINQDWQNNHLDKDIKYTGNKIYSPDTCLFVTQEINNLLTDNEAKRGELPKGVGYHEPSKRFHSRCSVNSKVKSLGLFDTPEQASKAYVTFKVELILSTAEQQEQPLKGYLIRIAGELSLPFTITLNKE